MRPCVSDDGIIVILPEELLDIFVSYAQPIFAGSAPVLNPADVTAVVSYLVLHRWQSLRRGPGDRCTVFDLDMRFHLVGFECEGLLS